MIYDQTFKMLFQQKMETIQYNAALAITGGIRGSSLVHAGIDRICVSTK